MAEARIQLKDDRDTTPQTEHLCYIVAQGFDVSDAQAYQALIRAPQFRCGRCGRTARSYRSLCVPVEL